MVQYYLDLALDFADVAGTDKVGAEYTGPGGFMAAKMGWGNATKLDAADVLDNKGTADLSKLVKITVDVDKSGTWAISDVVQNHNDGGGANGDDWVGELVFIDATTLWVQINGASTDIDSVSTADGVHNSTQADEIAGANMTAATAPGIEFSGSENDGTTAGNITIRGVKADWTVSTDPGNSLLYQAVWDANGKAFNCWSFLGAVLRWQIENQTWQEATNIGFDSNINACDHWVIRHCLAKDNGDTGIYVLNCDGLQLLSTVLRNNGADGLSGLTLNNLAYGCVTSGNTSVGLGLGSPSMVDSCLCYENGSDNISLDSASEESVIKNCVADGSTGGSGIKASDQDSITLLNNRLTNNNQYGIEFTAADASAWADWNVIFNNGVAARLNIAAGPNDDDAPADDGYVGAAGDDYNVKDGAEIRSTALILNWDGV